MEGIVNIKSAAEIAIMREAGRINAEALEAAKAAIARACPRWS
jgi:Xaa-Pro aminopeptidase